MPAPTRPQAPALTPLRIEGSIRHPADGEPWEYTVVVSIRNDRGEEIAHKLIGVGAMNPNEQRTFTLSVEAVSTKAKARGKAARGTEHPSTSHLRATNRGVTCCTHESWGAARMA